MKRILLTFIGLTSFVIFITAQGSQSDNCSIIRFLIETKQVRKHIGAFYDKAHEIVLIDSGLNLKCKELLIDGKRILTVHDSIEIRKYRRGNLVFNEKTKGNLIVVELFYKPLNLYGIIWIKNRNGKYQIIKYTGGQL